MITRKPWADMATDLVDVSMGRKPATMLVQNGRWVNVYSGEILPCTDVAIWNSRIAMVKTDAGYTAGPATVVLDADGRYLLPGLCDGHMHVESSMLSVTEFARAVMVHGTTSIFIDPHEIANVLGLHGVRLMYDEAEGLPINVYIQVPGCVPSAPGLETPGAELGPDEVAEALKWQRVVGLGEVMNFPGVANNDSKMSAEITAAMRANKTIGGHYATRDLGRGFHGYVAGGPQDDHEGTRLEDAVERVRRGMRPMLRYGSGWRDVASQVKAVTELGLDPRQFILCTDDCHSETLINEGHMNRVVRHAISEGLEPLRAIQMATLNTAQHFGLDRDVGSIAPGRYADMIITSDLKELPVEQVITAGVAVAEAGKATIDIPTYSYPGDAKQTVQLSREVTEDDFTVQAPNGNATATVRVIGVIEHQAPTRALQFELPIVNGVVQMHPERDICQAALVERHHGSGRVTNGWVNGFGFDQPCAVATTVAHDCHHLIVCGTRRREMTMAVNRLKEVGGGVVVFQDGKETSLVPLPIAGIMSENGAEVVAGQVRQMNRAMTACGCKIENAFMQLSLLGLVVIPELRLSDLGLVDAVNFRLVSPFVDP